MNFLLSNEEFDAIVNMYNSDDGFDVLYVDFINDTIPTLEPTITMGNVSSSI